MQHHLRWNINSVQTILALASSYPQSLPKLLFFSDLKLFCVRIHACNFIRQKKSNKSGKVSGDV